MDLSANYVFESSLHYPFAILLPIRINQTQPIYIIPAFSSKETDGNDQYHLFPQALQQVWLFQREQRQGPDGNTQAAHLFTIKLSQSIFTYLCRIWTQLFGLSVPKTRLSLTYDLLELDYIYENIKLLQVLGAYNGNLFGSIHIFFQRRQVQVRFRRILIFIIFIPFTRKEVINFFICYLISAQVSLG